MTAPTAGFESAAQGRAPPLAVKLLLPVWGHRYVNEFLEFGLPSLLAPGNIPALANALPCEFHMMTSALDAPVLADHPAWQKLQSICRVSVELIDDLITGDNHTTTITLAYARAIRNTGPQMVDTCFINVCGDYIYSDKALENVLKRMIAGASAVLAGNFQFVAEDGLPALRAMIGSPRVELPLDSRDLIRCGLTYLHPAAFANVVNFGLFHNEHTNRLFWRVDDSTLVGHFYLLHVVCVRPEVTEFVTGSSFDYSFVPELCPSNNVAVITDSDDYFVLEITARNHEARHLRPGPLLATDLVRSLAEWTTARHRQNAQSTLIFHAEEIPRAAAAVVAEADDYIGRVAAALTAPPQPHRNHPYWIGAIMAHRRALGEPDLDEITITTEPGRDSRTAQGVLALLWRLRMRYYGVFPELGACHPYWPDFRLPLEKLERLLAQGKRALIVAPMPSAYTAWLAKRSPQSVKMECERFLTMTERQYQRLFGAFDVCMVHLTERETKLGDQFIDRVAPLLRPDGVLLLLITNHRIDEVAEFKQSFAYHAVRFGNMALWPSGIRYVSITAWRAILQKRIVDIGRLAQRRPVIGLPLAALLGPLLLFASYLANRRAALGSSTLAGSGYCSSVLMELHGSGAAHGWPARFAIEGRGFRLTDNAAAKATTVDAAYHRLKSAESLVRSLARYRFVAKMLAGRKRVAQIGLSAPAGLDLVCAAVTTLTLFDAAKIPATKLLNCPPVDVQLHDIRKERLPGSHDALYSFDVLDDIPPEDEERVLRHIRDSLSGESDIAILGCSGSADAHAKAAGHFCRGGMQLRSLLSGYFNVVLMFSMVEEEIRPGLLPAADYYLAVASSRHR